MHLIIVILWALPRTEGLIGNRTRHTPVQRCLVLIDSVLYFNFSITFVAVTSFFYLVSFTSSLWVELVVVSSGCKTPRSEHTFGNPGKHCNGPAQGSDAAEDTAPPLESLPVEEVKELSVEDTLASLLGVVKSLTTGIKEVQADNQQLRAPLKDQLPPD